MKDPDFANMSDSDGDDLPLFGEKDSEESDENDTEEDEEKEKKLQMVCSVNNEFTHSQVCYQTTETTDRFTKF